MGAKRYLTLGAAALVAGALANPAGNAQERPDDRQRNRDSARRAAESLDLYTANLFHHRFDALRRGLPALRVSYNGELATPAGGPGLRPINVPVASLASWSVGAPREGSDLYETLFRIAVSVERRPETLAACTVGGKRLFLSAPFVCGGRTADDELPGVKDDRGKGFTARQLLRRLEGEAGRPEN
jgi:hypothetical protein